MSKPVFVYVTYIETTPEKLWQALTGSDFTERYWFGYRATSDWKPGSRYSFTKQDAPTMQGRVLVSEPPRRLAYSWDCCSPDAQGERTSRVTFELAPHGTVVKLTVTHDELDEGGVTLRNVSAGWPVVIASLKSLLETGHVLDIAPPTPAEREKVDA